MWGQPFLTASRRNRERGKGEKQPALAPSGTATIYQARETSVGASVPHAAPSLDGGVARENRTLSPSRRRTLERRCVLGIRRPRARSRVHGAPGRARRTGGRTVPRADAAGARLLSPFALAPGRGEASKEQQPSVNEDHTRSRAFARDRPDRRARTRLASDPLMRLAVTPSKPSVRRAQSFAVFTDRQRGSKQARSVGRCTRRRPSDSFDK